MHRLIYFFFKIFQYSFYKRKYKLPRSFRFNGYFVRIYGDGNIYSGERSYISYFSYINVAKNTSVYIGDDVSISHNVKIYTSKIDSGHKIKIKENQSLLGDVKIGNNVLIGANSYIDAGVKIGDNVVIGANSLVTRDVPSNSIAIGVPVKVIKKY